MSSRPQPRPQVVETREEHAPWQLKMLSKSLKKKQKLDLLLQQIGDARDKECLLITNGDNNGALNCCFRAHGGDWTWVENEADHISEMRDLLGDPVLKGSPSKIPAGDAAFDLVVSIDVHEHLEDCSDFNREIARVTRPGGAVVVTTPNDGPWKPVNVLKRLLGMSKERYGHVVIGYTVDQHRRMLSEVGLTPVSAGSYSRFFTELLELAINFAYVMVLSKKSGEEVKTGTIAPSSAEQLRSVRKQYRVYSAAYPVLYAISKLDSLLFLSTGYAVSVVSRKPA